MDAEDNQQRKKRWRLALGTMDSEEQTSLLSPRETEQDELLERVYPSERIGGLSAHRSLSAKWMGDVRSMFPDSVVKIIQKDALERFGIKKMLADPTFLEDVIPDVQLVGAILSVKQALPEKNLQFTKELVARLANKVSAKLQHHLLDRMHGRKDSSSRIKNPRSSDIDWHQTIKENLKYFQSSLQTIIPHTLVGHPRRRRSAKKIILLVDQSASMAESFVYAGILGSIMTLVPSIKTHFVAFDTEVVDLSQYLNDPVDLLFRAQLGGGTNIQKALGYALQLVERGADTTVILISDLYEGASEELLWKRIAALQRRAVPMINLLALDDAGVPAYDKDIARKMASLGVPSFACSPDQFPDLIATVLNNEGLDKFQRI
ncbi:MAG: VWA domain-containing protein [Saprospiraceae bacterium]|nr:VWA domain-containing protein [Saprospiraceae bacterium]